MIDPAAETKLRRASHAMRDVADAADEQGWLVKAHANGFLFMPPRERVRPGFETIFVHDPGSSSHSQRCVRNRLTRGGLKFDDDEHQQRRPVLSTVKPVATAPMPAQAAVKPAPTTEDGPVQRIRVHLDGVLDLFEKIAKELDNIDGDLAKTQKLRELLKSL